jgi:histidine triad (HIT) family protein
MKLVPKLGAAMAKQVGAGGWNFLQNNGAVAGQVVEHVHFHIIPRHDDDQLGYRWPAGSLDTADAQVIIDSITNHLAD